MSRAVTSTLLLAACLIVSPACDGSGDLVREEDGALVGANPDVPLDGLPDPSVNDVDETCDGFDNDVDGRVDEGCYCREGEEQPCYPDHFSRLDVGICEAGLQRCEGVSGDFQLGTWGECLGAVLPAVEICDNAIDEDCSGADAECPPPVDGCQPGQMRSCYPAHPETLGIGICSAGLQICGAAAGWGPCEGAIVPNDEICNNAIDEDCNGADLNCS